SSLSSNISFLHNRGDKTSSDRTSFFTLGPSCFQQLELLHTPPMTPPYGFTGSRGPGSWHFEALSVFNRTETGAFSLVSWLALSMPITCTRTHTHRSLEDVSCSTAPYLAPST
ncbi:unnamed protein product, partial [Ectocarpus sp. 8 AP-2014]